MSAENEQEQEQEEIPLEVGQLTGVAKEKVDLSLS